MMRDIWKTSVLEMVTAVTAVGAMTGCGSGNFTSTAAAPTIATAASIQGVFMGGQQPVAGVSVQLYQAGATGYGSAATPLGPAVLTTAGGNFTLPSYTCAAGSQVYLVGMGGQPIAATQGGPAITNANLAMMVGLGTCGGTDLETFISVNELTTVATVWALAPFMTGITSVGSSASNPTGLQNAFAAIDEIVSTANGTISGPALPTGAVLPITEINTIADMIEQCVNSGGGTAGDSSNCGNLFELAPSSSGSIYPTDTITAALNIAHNPGRNVAALNRLRSTSPVFEPALNVNSPPSAWTIAITYSGGGLDSPSSVATDAAGSVWVTNSGNASVTKLDNTGAAVSGSSGFTAGGFSRPAAIAVDTSGYAWIANSGNNTITELNSAGTTGTVYSVNGLNSPSSIAIDGSGNIWISNGGSNMLSAFTGTGSVLTGSPFPGAGTTTPVSIAITPK
jgi:hypothetical protein